jgi:hypothetical protein
LDRETLLEVCQALFVQGSIPSGRGIFAPLVQVNDLHGSSDQFGTPVLNADIDFLRDALQIYCFYYGPPLWMFGKTPGEDGAVEWYDGNLDHIIENCSDLSLSGGAALYRVQLNLGETDLCACRFCSPPQENRMMFWRFDNEDLPICYTAFDVETCLHETRVSLEDEIYVGVLKPRRNLRLLDLSTCATPEGTTQFEDPAIWLRSLLYNGKESYETCRRLATRIRDRGYDGFMYESYPRVEE